MRTASSQNAIVVSQHESEERPPRSHITLASSAITQGECQAPGHLTPRQLEVLALLCEGLPNKLICRRLNISAGTVKAHISSILRELGVASRLQAVVAARRRGLIEHRLEHNGEGDHNGSGAGAPWRFPAA